MRQYYKVDVISPLVLSQSHATSGAHQSLDYIPGNVLLGALAAKTYRYLTAQQSWDVFHSGKVQFGPAYIASKSNNAWHPSFPIPLSWHISKGHSLTINKDAQEVIDRSQVQNFSAQDFVATAEQQAVQCRQGYIDEFGNYLNVKKSSTTKTAINRATGAVEEGQLFEYQYINPGQSFIGYIDIDNQALVQSVLPQLEGDLTLGRSRSAEFGRVKLSLLPEPSVTIQPKINTSQLIVWLTSDLLVNDLLGMPSTIPHPEFLGLAGLKFQPQSSFIRTQSVSLFNRQRGGFDSQHQLISKGSVLVFAVDKSAPILQLESKLSQALGLRTDLGYGQCCVNPNWSLLPDISSNRLFDAPNWQCAETEHSEKNLPVNASSSNLIAWVMSKVDKLSVEQNRKKNSSDLARKIIRYYQQARAYNNILNSNEAGPSSNQWRRLFEVVKTSNADNWQTTAFEGEHAICKAKNDELGWGIEWSDKGDTVSFTYACQTLLKDLTASDMLVLLELLCIYDLSTYKGCSQFDTYLSHYNETRELV